MKNRHRRRERLPLCALLPILKNIIIKSNIIEWRTLQESLLIGVGGRELRIVFIYTSAVKISSTIIISVPTAFLKCPSNDLTNATHKPPKFGVRGGINRNYMPSELTSLMRQSCNFWWWKNRWSLVSLRFTPTNFVTLTHIISLGFLRWTMNRFSADRNAYVYYSEVNH